jgi:predicted DNA-binding antitoxin AbrB/MazE fold protein
MMSSWRLMSSTIKAVYEDGVFKPKEPVSLEEHAEVDVVIRPPIMRPEYDEDDPTGWKAIDDLIGCIKGAPPDVAENHDKYLYGDPDD